jgi:hypothetical protein
MRAPLVAYVLARSGSLYLPWLHVFPAPQRRQKNCPADCVEVWRKRLSYFTTDICDKNINIDSTRLLAIIPAHGKFGKPGRDG